MGAEKFASLLVDRVRARPWGLATVAIVGDDTVFAIDPGDDPIDEDSLFQIGSITKTMTGVLLAYAVIRGETSAEATLGDILDIDGPAAKVTLEALVRHESGLPRLPVNLGLDTLDPADPYAQYSRDDLIAGLNDAELGEIGVYSNFGFMTLGLCLSETAGSPLGEMLRARIFEPIGMITAACPAADANRVPGYAKAAPTPWWRGPLPGAGGVGASIRDLAAYLRAHIDVPAGTLGEAITVATTLPSPEAPVGYGWHFRHDCWFHNGGTGGFHSFAAFDRRTRRAVGMLVNNAESGFIDDIGFATLKEMLTTS